MPSQASSRISHQKTRRGRTGQDGPRMLGSPCGAYTSDGAVRGVGFWRVVARWGAGAVPGPGFESGKRFFSRGVFTRPKRERESDGCPPPLHPPPAGMQAYAVACMPHSTRRRLRSPRRSFFQKSEVSKGVSQTKASEVSKGVSKQRLQARRRRATAARFASRLRAGWVR